MEIVSLTCLVSLLNLFFCTPGKAVCFPLPSKLSSWSPLFFKLCCDPMIGATEVFMTPPSPSEKASFYLCFLKWPCTLFHLIESPGFSMIFHKFCYSALPGRLKSMLASCGSLCSCPSAWVHALSFQWSLYPSLLDLFVRILLLDSWAVCASWHSPLGCWFLGVMFIRVNR